MEQTSTEELDFFCSLSVVYPPRDLARSIAEEQYAWSWAR